jgi:hypothetical protein
LRGRRRADTRDLLEAQASLLEAQNAVTSALIEYTLARLNLFLDMELLFLEPTGIRLDANSLERQAERRAGARRPSMSNKKKQNRARVGGRPVRRDRRRRLVRRLVQPAVKIGAQGRARRTRPLTISVLQRGNLAAKDAVSIKSEIEGQCTILGLIQGGHRSSSPVICSSSSTQRPRSRRRSAQDISVQNAEASYTKAKARYDIQESQNKSDIEAAERKLTFAKIDQQEVPRRRLRSAAEGRPGEDQARRSRAREVEEHDRVVEEPGRAQAS